MNMTDYEETHRTFRLLVPDDFNYTRDVMKDQDQCKRTTAAPYKHPREVEFVAELPKTISGKIRRVELRQQEGAE